GGLVCICRKGFGGSQAGYHPGHSPSFMSQLRTKTWISQDSSFNLLSPQTRKPQFANFRPISHYPTPSALRWAVGRQHHNPLKSRNSRSRSHPILHKYNASGVRLFSLCKRLAAPEAADFEENQQDSTMVRLGAETRR